MSDSAQEPIDETLEELLGLSEPGPDDNQVVVPDAEAAKEGLSEAQIEQALRKANRLLKKDPDLLGMAIVTVVARQLYMQASAAINDRLEKAGHPQASGVHAAILDKMAELSLKPYTRKDVLDKLHGYALPFAMAELREEATQVEQSAAQERAQEDAKREGTQLPLGFPLDLGGPPQMTRDRMVILAGPPRLVQLLLDQATNHVLLQRETDRSPYVVTVRLAATMLAGNSQPVQEIRKGVYTELGASMWTHCAENSRAFDRFMERPLKLAYKNRADLLIVDDVSQLQKPLIADARPEHVAASVQRTLRRWSLEQKCGVLCGLPLKLPPDQYEGHAWSQLEIYTDVRVVSARPTDEGRMAVCLHNPFKGDISTAFALFSVVPKLVQEHE